MKINIRRFLYKEVLPLKGNVITTWKDDDPIESFSYSAHVKVPLSMSTEEIKATYREMTAKRAEKLTAQKEGKIIAQD